MSCDCVLISAWAACHLAEVETSDVGHKRGIYGSCNSVCKYKKPFFALINCLEVWFLLKIFQVILHVFLDAELQNNKDSFSLQLNWQLLKGLVYHLHTPVLQAWAHRISWMVHSSDRKLIPTFLPHAKKYGFCDHGAELIHPSGKLHKDRWYRGKGGKKIGQHLQVTLD